METLTPTLPVPSLNGHALLPSCFKSQVSGLKSSPQTGPKTQAGKFQMRTHAIKHGLTATDDVFVESLSAKQRAAYSKIRRALYNFYSPKTALEHLLVDRMAVQHLRMLTLYRVESVAMRFLPINKGSDFSVFPHLDRFSRYDSRLEKQLRILHNRYLSVREQNTSNRFKSFPVNE